MSENKSIESETPAAVAGAAPCSANYELFKHMSDTYQLTLLESELYDIEAEVVRGIIARDMKPLLWRICDGLAQESTTEAQHVERAEACLKAWLKSRGNTYSPNDRTERRGTATLENQKLYEQTKDAQPRSLQ